RALRLQARGIHAKRPQAANGMDAGAIPKAVRARYCERIPGVEGEERLIDPPKTFAAPTNISLMPTPRRSSLHSGLDANGTIPSLYDRNQVSELMKSISWGSVVVMVAALAIPGELAFSGETGDSPVTLSEPSDQQGLRHYFGAPAIVGKEDEFCRRAYQVMLKGAAFCKDLYHEWPTEPDCGYIGWGGHAEKEINANIQMAYLYALVAHFGQYDGQVTGVSREEALRRVRGVIRYCAFTHFSGPHRCTSGKSWGGGWHDASWSSGFARMVWLCWPDLDDETREMAARVIVAEADRFVDAQPTSRKIDDTKAESNAWNTRSLAVAVTMFPNHPRASKWRDAYHRWTMNTLSVAADQNDDTLIEGKPVREWVTTENIHSDFTLENHDIVYPVYMWCSMDGLCQGASSFVIAGQRAPQTAHHHLRDIYE